jgi:Na+/H+ antiporter NhaD/arsenite permease-like protein
MASGFDWEPNAGHESTIVLQEKHARSVASRLFLRKRWLLLGAAAAALAATRAGVSPDFVLFGLTLLGVAVLHRHAMPVALTGLVVITLHGLAFDGFPTGVGVAGLARLVEHEWVTLANLLGLLLGFALLSKHFEDSHAPAVLPRFLPDDWKGGFMLLAMVFVLSSFLDNIAAALIGGTVARVVFRGRVHIGYLAGIVAAANAGGAGSVVGDTTTTMMWIDGLSPVSVLHAYVAAAVTLLVSGTIAARQQQAHSPIVKDALPGQRVDLARVGVVAFILAVTAGTNVVVNLRFPELLDHVPVLGVAIWAALLVTSPLRKADWSLLPGAFKSTAFLLSLVLCASMMPVDELPPASWHSAMGLGFVSSVFDNIPLTALALDQGGYDWGVLAYAVGYGGSMVWFGSSAGVALSSTYPEARSVGRWLVKGWHVPLAYVIGYLVLVAVMGWQPEAHPGHAEQAHEAARVLAEVP